jgi:hypothetical protein
MMKGNMEIVDKEEEKKVNAAEKALWHTESLVSIRV